MIHTGAFRLGLTGGIGSGKSTVAQALVELGAVLVDTDAISRSLTAPGGAALPKLAALFGPQALAADGALNRAFMRELVFSQPAAKAQLEAVLHPLISQQALQAAALAADRPVVFDVPLLTAASHWRGRMHRVLVVDCSESTQAARVSKRPGWSGELARQVMAQQTTREQRRALADAVIQNDGGLSLAGLQAEVGALWQHWVAQTWPKLV